MCNLYSENVFKSEWMELVYTISNESGMTDVWFYQGMNINNISPKTKLTQILNNKFQQHWVSEMANSSKCVLYKTFKTIYTLRTIL